jgi:hypothetical protein
MGNKKLYGGLLVVILGALTLIAASIAQGPDKELHFEREARSSADISNLSQVLTDASLWPNWFFALEQVKLLGSPSETAVTAGQKYQLFINSRKSPWSHMEFTIQVLEASPAHLRMRVLEDSKGKLTRLFDRLDWEIRLEPEAQPAQGTIIRGKATAHTSHWRSRLFGTITEKVLMNQVYYMDLIHLSKLTSFTSSGRNMPSALSSSDALISLPMGLPPKKANEPGKNEKDPGHTGHASTGREGK